MARIPIMGQLLLSARTPSVDAKYGPYSSVYDAYNKLGPDGMDALCYGLTVGITQEDGNIKEYVITKLTNTDEITVNNFKEKNGNSLNDSFITYKGTTTTSADNEIKDVTISNFKIDTDGKPKDLTCLILTFVNGNTSDTVSICVNNMDIIPMKHKKSLSIGFIEQNTVSLLIYDKSENIWNILNGIETSNIRWT